VNTNKTSSKKKMKVLDTALVTDIKLSKCKKYLKV